MRPTRTDPATLRHLCDCHCSGAKAYQDHAYSCAFMQAANAASSDDIAARHKWEQAREANIRAGRYDPEALDLIEHRSQGYGEMTRDINYLLALVRAKKGAA